jgi:hypothetical protein
MSARKISSSNLVQSVSLTARTTRLDLPQNAVRIRKNGIEFRSANPVPTWSEMTVSLQTPLSGRAVNFTGVVVACDGNRHAGYIVSLVFTHMTRQTQARLNSLAVAP